MNTTSTPYTDPSVLYAGTDFSKLSWLELQWASWYIWIGNPILATGLASFLLHEVRHAHYSTLIDCSLFCQVVYFGRAIPWIIIDALPYFRRWKLQPNKIPTVGEQWACTKQVLFSHFTVELPVIWLFHPMAEFFGMATWQVPFPAWSAIAPQVFFFFVFEDMFHYFGASVLLLPFSPSLAPFN